MESLVKKSFQLPSLTSARFDRRELLRVAALGGAGWLTNIANSLALKAESLSHSEPAQSVILLWLEGGPSQLETFDPHPKSKFTGPAGVCKTSVNGVSLSGWLPRIAEQMGSISLIRSMVSKEGDHARGVYLAKTGYRPNPTVVHPSLGAICCHELDIAGTEIPRHVSILPTSKAARGGYLGAEYDAFKTGDPSKPVPDVISRVDEKTYRQRLSNLEVLERSFSQGRKSPVEKTLQKELLQGARSMMTSAQVAAFDINNEPKEVQEKFGDSPFGRGCLAARRLIEVGVRCVEVTLSGWDSHVNNHAIHRKLTAVLDPAFSALIADLRERDLLQRTMVLCLGEFGRSPKVNPLEGRDHWPHGFSVAIAGGGIRGGQVIGRTDPQGSKKVDHPHSFADLNATILRALGIDPQNEYVSPVGRPIKLSEGIPLDELYS